MTKPEIVDFLIEEGIQEKSSETGSGNLNF